MPNLRQIGLRRNSGDAEMTISFGCTGGHHRSVTFAIEVSNALKQNEYDVCCFHRDINIED